MFARRRIITMATTSSPMAMAVAVVGPTYGTSAVRTTAANRLLPRICMPVRRRGTGDVRSRSSRDAQVQLQGFSWNASAQRELQWQPCRLHLPCALGRYGREKTEPCGTASPLAPCGQRARAKLTPPVRAPGSRKD